MYPAELVQPMRDELTAVGFDQLADASAVVAALAKEGTTLVVVNSVCGCAAANARPGVRMSLANEKNPDQLTTVFAGVDRDATNAARQQMVPFPPSSPSIALFKDGSWCICWNGITLRDAPPNSLPKTSSRPTTPIAKLPCAKRWLFR